MIPVHIVGLALDVKSQPVVILKPVGEETGEGRMLPIWIGGLEAAAILQGVNGDPAPRPLTLDLMRHVLEALDTSVERVAITRIEGGTFYAEITLSTPGGQIVLDARPSDALGLAVRTGTVIWAAESVLDDAAIPDDREHEVDEEAEVEAFTKFLEDVEPEDFQG
ncbi:bifunctional nuclease family protein [Tessaracoccus sp. MC1679]|uniref:bifunctional nuclease family protein n=1 Tax=Tessaracoccus sp. MC1679 TaxID=2760313 RepID=UPI001603464F|nr:bifunctional nuclease family protein [Tessaracoccus sp. MC1679]MBB1517261.1 bifunctional nuclease family protein [Tessaracoccus sp. MC1679]